MFDFAKEIYFDEIALSNKSTGDKSLIRTLKSPAIMASGISTKFLPENLDDLFDRTKLLLQEKQFGNKSDINNEKIVTTADKLLEYKSLTAKKHKFLLLKCLN